ncbi:MAG TPA: PEP-CTERM sorting domain-containing protein [Candidatus Acidoferrales bacterium]|nr:PEP-CTERM sorting domain-containing protein [Candidatus Acidoferrales bacterium]
MWWYRYWKSWNKLEGLVHSSWRLTQCILLIGTVLPLVLVVWKLHAVPPLETRTPPVVSSVPSANFEVPLTDAGRSLRPMLPYSVIPGGAADAAELRNAIVQDPVVAIHYAVFDISRTHVVRLDSNRALYVSYRLGDRVFWTKKKLILPRGETVLTDGQHLARTRCGNRLSETAEVPTSPKEPERAALETPEAPELTGLTPPPELPLTPIGPVPPPPETGPILPPPVPIFWGVGPPPGTPAPPIVPPGVPPPATGVPEPGTALLVLAGFLVLFTMRRKIPNN